MNKKYDNILNHVYGVPWLITEDGLEAILGILDRKIDGESLSLEQLEEMRDRGSGRNHLDLPEQPGIAVLPIHGSIFPKANLLTEFSGGTSVNAMMSDLDTLMAEDNVKGILLDIDSPGGSATMIQEGADAIWEARQSGKKPIWAIANSQAASAAYYLGSQAEKLFMTPSGTVGSIGVISVHTDESGADAKDGIKRTVLTVGENKGIGHPALPLSDKAREIVMEQMTEVYDEFTSAVARGRGVSADHVVENYGKGRVYKSRTALEKGMVDGVKTIRSVSENFLQEVFSKPTSKSVSVPRQVGAKMAEITPEILESLELSEDATPEDVLTAIQGIRENTPEPAPAPVQTQVTPEFEKAYPELAAKLKSQEAEMAELREGRRKDAAKLFAADYEKFSDDNGETGFGLSGLALTQVEDMHLKIADGLVTHDDLSSLLDCVASGKGVVDYREIGSGRGKEPEVPASRMEAGQQLANKAREIQVETGESYGDALVKVMNDPENAEIVEAYQSRGGEE